MAQRNTLNLMPEPLDLVVVNIPARIANLAFSIALPRDWNVIDLPEEEVDFSSPEKFFPLMIAATPWAAVIRLKRPPSW